MKTPFLFAGRRVHRVEIAVPASEKQNARRQRRRRVNDVTRFEFPTQIARPRVQSVKISVAATEINGAICDDRTRQKNVKWVGDRLVFWLPSMYTFRLKPALALCRELPL